MEARARVTSKGQVTIPVEVRRELGIEEGDLLVFELAASYATLRKRRDTLEVAAELSARYLAGRDAPAITDREAVERYFDAEREERAGATLLVSRGDGTFEGDDATEIGADDAAC